MQRRFIEEKIHENLSNIKVGQVFPTQAKLFEALGIPPDGNGNNTTRKIVKTYVDWELTGSLNKNNRPSKELRVIKINCNPEHIDRRKNNGGAHNDVFGPIIKPALLYYKYPPYITYSQIFEKVYGFPNGYFTSMNHQSLKCTKHVLQYRKKCEEDLRGKTKTALNALQRENLIKWDPVYLIKGYPQCFGKNHPSNCLDGFKIDSNTLLEDVLKAVWLPIKGSQYLEEFENAVNQSSEFGDEHFHVEKQTLFQFVKIALKENQSINQSLKNHFYNFAELTESDLANTQQSDFIDGLKNIVSDKLGITQQEVHLNSQKAKKYYNFINIIYNLLGWDNLWSGLHIDVYNTGNYKNEYRFDQLQKIMEPRIANEVVHLHYNPYKIEQKKRLKHKPKFGTYSDLIVDLDEDIFYLAKDPAVSREHCKLFGLPIRDDYFKNQLDQLHIIW